MCSCVFTSREPPESEKEEEMIDELELRSPEEEKPPRSESDIMQWLQSLFLFSMCWSLGGNLDSDSRVKFSDFFKMLAAGTNKHYRRLANIF